MKLTKDLIEATIGAFSAMLFFYALRVDSLSLDPKIGLGITLAWIFVYYKGGRIPTTNFVLGVAVSAAVSSLMALMFGLATVPELMSFNFFGSTAVIGLWIGLPTALIMDKYNVTNLLKTKYVRRK